MASAEPGRFDIVPPAYQADCSGRYDPRGHVGPCLEPDLDAPHTSRIIGAGHVVDLPALSRRRDNIGGSS
jgi:hypothetical protein